MELTVEMYAKIHGMNFNEQIPGIQGLLQSKLDECETPWQVMCPITWILTNFLECKFDHTCKQP